MNAYFYSMLHRMRHIQRWSLMRNTEKENILEHSIEVAYLTHALILIREKLYPESDLHPEMDTAVLLALYHDVAEMITGDLPTPVKYFNPGLRSEFQNLEDEARRMMLRGIPEALRDSYETLLFPPKESPEDKEALRFVKAADTLSAYIKCLDERNAGNREFISAEAEILRKLKDYQLPELDYFMEHMLPAYQLTLDEMRREAETQD